MSLFASRHQSWSDDDIPPFRLFGLVQRGIAAWTAPIMTSSIIITSRVVWLLQELRIG